MSKPIIVHSNAVATTHQSENTSEINREASAVLYLGDCLEQLKRLADNSIDMVLADLPYGTTRCAWDSVIPLDKLWRELHRVTKLKGVFAMTAQQPFTSQLLASNPKNFRFELIWSKPNGTNPLNARRMPMKKHENILIFCRKAPTYSPQMEPGRPYQWNSRRTGGTAGGIELEAAKPIDNCGERFPGSVLHFKQERGLHPTQKPVALLQWLIRTYSLENDVVLDCTMGSGSTGVAALRCGRRFVGIEREAQYFATAIGRLDEVRVS